MEPLQYHKDAFGNPLYKGQFVISSRNFTAHRNPRIVQVYMVISETPSTFKIVCVGDYDTINDEWDYYIAKWTTSIGTPCVPAINMGHLIPEALGRLENTSFNFKSTTREVKYILDNNLIEINRRYDGINTN